MQDSVVRLGRRLVQRPTAEPAARLAGAEAQGDVEIFRALSSMTSMYEIAPTGAVARPLHDHDAFSHRLQFQPGRVEAWPDLRWSVRTELGPDWVWTVDAIRLVSPTVRAVIEAEAGPRDDIQWLPATVVSARGTEQPYWVPHFPTWHDVLDHELTTWDPNQMPIRWVLSASKVVGLSVFVIPRSSLRVVASDAVVRALQHTRASGFSVEPARIR